MWCWTGTKWCIKEPEGRKGSVWCPKVSVGVPLVVPLDVEIKHTPSCEGPEKCLCQVLPNFWLWLITRSPFTLTDLLSPPSLLCWGHSTHCPWHLAAWCTPCWATGSWLSPSRRCHRSGRRRVVPGSSWALLWSCRSWHRCGRSTAPSCSLMWPRTLTERCLEEIEKKTTMGTISFLCFCLQK